jgi:hypothetical protein
MGFRLVLATDMSKHFSILTACQAKVLNQDSTSTPGPARFKNFTNEQLHILLQLFLKVADLGHCALPIKLHIRWVYRLQEEMWAQGDEEKSQGLPVSPLADRTKPGPLYGGNQVSPPCPRLQLLTIL